MKPEKALVGPVQGQGTDVVPSPFLGKGPGVHPGVQGRIYSVRTCHHMRRLRHAFHFDQADS